MKPTIHGKKNLLFQTDSYKYSHHLQYPPGTDGDFRYFESRGGRFPATLFFGLQILLKEHLDQKISLQDVYDTREFTKKHGLLFHEEGWEHIVREYSGRLPITIKAAPEGMLIPNHNVSMTLEVASDDKEIFWLGSHMETMLVRMWYPITVATHSFMCKRMIKEYMKSTCDNLNGLSFKLHDFGARGVSSHESACIGGAAHLVNFQGSDTVEGIVTANEVYNHSMAAYSIPAAEHGTITAWGNTWKNELAAYDNMLKQFAKPGSVVAIVSDSYDIMAACKVLWGIELRDKVIASGATVVIRPDSGDPLVTVPKIINILDESFGHTINTKGYKVLNNVRIIQGDSVNELTIHKLLFKLMESKWSTDNINFGMGGELLQNWSRDTNMFAMKCSATRRNGKWFDAYKSPVDAPFKVSKAGRLSLYKKDKRIVTMRIEDADGLEEILKPVFVDGKIVKEYTLDEIRARAGQYL